MQESRIFISVHRNSCLSSMLIWSNLRCLNSVNADAGIAAGDKDNVARDLGIVVI